MGISLKTMAIHYLTALLSDYITPVNFYEVIVSLIKINWRAFCIE